MHKTQKLYLKGKSSDGLLCSHLVLNIITFLADCFVFVFEYLKLLIAVNLVSGRVIIMIKF